MRGCSRFGVLVFCLLPLSVAHAVEGVSLVANYRAQFNKVIRTDSYETLVEKLKSHQFSAPAASPSGKVTR